MVVREHLGLTAAAAEQRLRERIRKWPSATRAATREARLSVKRHVSDLRRHARKSWRRLFPEIPYPIVPALKEVVTIPQEDITIALLSKESALAVSAGAQSDRPRTARPSRLLRKRMRGLLHDHLSDSVKIAYDVSPIDQLAWTRHEKRGLAGIATAKKPRVAIRTLDTVGVALIQGLDDASKESLESAGMTLLPNEFLPLIPAELASSAGGSTPAWHLDHIKHHVAKAGGLHGQNARLGIIDTGINAIHPEFKGRQVMFQKFAVDGNLIESPTRDWHGHGTQVAGLAAGNTRGVAPKAQILMAAALTVRSQEGIAGAHLAQILAAVNWLRQNKVDIINMSLAFDEGNPRFTAKDQETIANIAKAIKEMLFSLGILTVAAIGNDGEDNPTKIMSPARWPSCIGVGAVDGTDAVAAFSTRADNKPDLYAPGVALQSAAHTGTGWSKPANGTSFATPLVSGALALLIGRERSISDANTVVAHNLLRQELMTLTRTVGSPPHHIQILDLTKVRTR